MQFFFYAILLITIFIIQAQGFCIYNFMDEGSSFRIFDGVHLEAFSAFQKTLGIGGKECCHFENAECNASLKRDEDIFFQIQFTFKQADGRLTKTPTFMTKCTGGGALAFYGSALDFWGLCTPAHLPTHQALLDKNLVNYVSLIY